MVGVGRQWQDARAFNALVGANGAGKTSILEGLFSLSQFRYKSRLPFSRAGGS